MKGFLYGISAALLLCAAAAFAQTSRQLYSQDIVQNMQRPCSFSGKVAVVVAAGAASAATPSAFDRGNIAMICSTAVHFRTATTAPTAVATDMLLPANTLLTFASESDFVAVIQDAAGGNCFLVQCR